MRPGNFFLRIVPLVVVSFLAVGCLKTEFNKELAELDVMLAKSGQIRDSLENRYESLKGSLKASDNATSLGILYELARTYRFYDCDSALKYSNLLYELASVEGCQEIKSAAIIERAFNCHFRNQSDEAATAFESIDTSSISSPEIWTAYYECGHTIYKIFKPAQLMKLHADCISKIPRSQIGTRIRISDMMKAGQYTEALNLLKITLDSGEWSNREQAVFKLYIANCHKALGDKRNQLKWLVRSSEDDCLSGYRQYSSLKHIADELYDFGEYDKVAKYLTICLDDFHTGSFENRTESGNESLQMMEETIIKLNKLYHIILFVTIAAAALAILAISYAYHRAIRQRNRMKKLSEKLVEVNKQLKNRERELSTANLVRDKYVFKFMRLSKDYISQIDTHTKQLNRILKSEGTEALARELRRQDITETSRKEFYATFDQTFLGLFPDFVDKFNSLLPEEERMYIKNDGGLCTEMRIFASIKLGITSSKEIAEFLDYALTTVYTYRTRIKNKAVCDKDEFEKIICE